MKHLTADDLYLFNEGSHCRLYDKLGAHPTTVDGVAGTQFAVWAPSAERVCVMGDFNDWNKSSHPLQPLASSGIWTGFLPGVGRGSHYKYHIASQFHGYRVDKADPFAFRAEMPPKTGSVVWTLDYEWNDAEWMANRKTRNDLHAPISIYEVHLGSWRRVLEDGYRSLSYREAALHLVDYVKRMNYTHVEFLPLTEHPFFGSWGYQTTGFFAPTSRFGDPQDLMYLIDVFHQNGIGVILDWVPSHFPTDEHGLAYFDGTHLYEHANPQQGYHPDWGSYIFNYDRHEVRSFLLSSAMFWLDRYHIDGLRVDAVASMLYLDYSRKPGEWVPNVYGGRENLGAIHFLRKLNEQVYRSFPDTQTIAEESTSWPMVSRPTFLGGLGFGLKWDMGWMHDTLQYFGREPIHRRYHHGELLFRMVYAFSENFVMPLSHDEVVHGKGSLLNRMPGDDWQKLANCRLLFGYLYGQPGKKLLFMGMDIGQWGEWKHDASVDWHLLDWDRHRGMQKWVADLNQFYRDEPALYERDIDPSGFAWADCHDAESSTLAWTRRGTTTDDYVLVVCNFTPVVRQGYHVGVPRDGWWWEVLNSDATEYGGSGVGNLGVVQALPVPFHGQPWSVKLTLPPLGAVFLKNSGGMLARSVTVSSQPS